MSVSIYYQITKHGKINCLTCNQGHPFIIYINNLYWSCCIRNRIRAYIGVSSRESEWLLCYTRECREHDRMGVVPCTLPHRNSSSSDRTIYQIWSWIEEISRRNPCSVSKIASARDHGDPVYQYHIASWDPPQTRLSYIRYPWVHTRRIWNNIHVYPSICIIAWWWEHIIYYLWRRHRRLRRAVTRCPRWLPGRPGSPCTWWAPSGGPRRTGSRPRPPSRYPLAMYTD